MENIIEASIIVKVLLFLTAFAICCIVEEFFKSKYQEIRNAKDKHH